MNSNKRARSWMEHWNCNLNIHKLKYRYIYIYMVCVYIYIHTVITVYITVYILYIYTSYIYIYVYVILPYIYIYMYIFQFKFQKTKKYVYLYCCLPLKCERQLLPPNCCQQPMSPDQFGTNETRDIGHVLRSSQSETNGFVWRFRGKHHIPVDYHQWIISFPSKMVVLGGIIFQF